MGFRFRQSVKLCPGVRLNISGSGASLSAGPRGATLNFSGRGARATFGVPGTGMSFSTPLFSPQTRPRGADADGSSSSPIRSTAELTEAVRNPRSTVVYSSSGRRLSSQQLAAAYRKLAETEAREKGQADIERFEAELNALVDSWKGLPSIPSADGYKTALEPRPFVFAEQPPTPPAYEAEERDVRARVRADEVTRNPPSIKERAAPWLASLGTAAAVGATIFLLQANPPWLGTIALFPAIVVGVLLENRRSKLHERRVEAATELRFPGEWKARRDQLTQTHDEATRAFEARRAQAEAEWNQAEAERVAFASRLVQGDVEAMHEAIANSLSDLDFPFETKCASGIEGASEAVISLDLPEIEDVIPEVRYQVLKSGQLKPVKREQAERNRLYAQLTCGLALMMAATAFAAAPTLQRVTVAGYTQRKQRGAAAVEDQFVIETRISRDAVCKLQPSDADPIAFVGSQQTRLDWGSSFLLKKIQPPPWALDLREGLDEDKGPSGDPARPN